MTRLAARDLSSLATVAASEALIISLLMLAAFPTTAAAQQPGPGSSSGTAVITGEPGPGTETISYTVLGSPAGATGTISYQHGTLVIQATPVCIGVLGNRAFIVGLITSSTAPSGSAGVGGDIVFWVDDNGTPGASTDRAEVGFSSGGATSFCLASHLSPGPVISAGEIVVTEPPPECDREAFKASQRQEREAFEATNPSKEARKAFASQQKQERKDFKKGCDDEDDDDD